MKKYRDSRYKVTYKLGNLEITENLTFIEDYTGFKNEELISVFKAPYDYYHNIGTKKAKVTKLVSTIGIPTRNIVNLIKL